MPVTVGKASLRHLNELLRIERECFTTEAFTKEQIEVLLRNPNGFGFLAQVKEEVVGFIIGEIEKHRAIKVGHVCTIDVAVKYRRRGVGLKLLKEIENAFLQRGAETCYLEVRVGNNEARRLYEKQGYVELEDLDNYYSRGGHGLRLVKQLKPKQNAFS